MLPPPSTTLAACGRRALTLDSQRNMRLPILLSPLPTRRSCVPMRTLWRFGSIPQFPSAFPIRTLSTEPDPEPTPTRSAPSSLPQGVPPRTPALVPPTEQEAKKTAAQEKALRRALDLAADMEIQEGEEGGTENTGLKFEAPAKLGKQSHLRDRYDPVVTQVTKLLMRDGKLSKAQRDIAMILQYLRTSPPPKVDPQHPLLPGSPPAEHLPLDPVQYLRIAIDSVAPLIRIRSLKGMAGGGLSLDLPQPLPVRQRRRTAFMWILDVVKRKRSWGSGRTMFAHRVAEELIAVAEGRSDVWVKRQQVHKQGTSARANLNSPALRRRRR